MRSCTPRVRSAAAANPSSIMSKTVALVLSSRDPNDHTANAAPMQAGIPTKPASSASSATRRLNLLWFPPGTTMPSSIYRGAIGEDSGASHYLACLEHVLNQLQLAPHKKNVMHLDLLRMGACCLDNQVAGAEAKQPVAEQVAAPFGDNHAHGVVSHFATADVLAHHELPRGENHVRPTIEEQDDHEPEGEKREANSQVAEGVDVYMRVSCRFEDIVPPI